MMNRLAHLALVLVFLVGCSSSPPGTGGTGGGNPTGTGGGAAGTGGGATGTGGGATGTGGGATGTGGGTQGTGGGFAGDAGSFGCDIQPVLSARCQDCHSNPTKFGAPMPLVTYQDTQAVSPTYPGQKMFQRMALRVADTVAPMPQAPNPRLAAHEIAGFQSWAAAGAPMGTCELPDAGLMDAGMPSDAGPDDCPPGTTELKIVAPAFTIPAQTDFYQCFATTISLPGKRHAVKVTKVIDDARVLHHMVLFRDLGKNAPATKANCGIEADWSVLYAWAPGAGPMEPPSDVGMPLNNGDQMVIQIHYNNSGNVMGVDSSGAKICLSSTLRPKEGGVLAIGPQSFTLPPNCPKAEAEGTCENYSFLNTTYNVFTVWPHMHLRGTALTSTNGNTVVTDRPNYSFNAQYLEKANFQFKPGDKIKTKCRWNTVGATAPVKWGEDTAEEMCFNFLYVWPAPPVAYCPSSTGANETCVP